MPGTPRCWTTANEIKFIKGLGSHGHRMYSGRVISGNIGYREPAPLLRKYIKAAELREDWGEIDKAECIAVAESLLNNLE